MPTLEVLLTRRLYGENRAKGEKKKKKNQKTLETWGGALLHARFSACGPGPLFLRKQKGSFAARGLGEHSEFQKALLGSELLERHRPGDLPRHMHDLTQPTN